MQDADLFMELAGIAGVFVGFGALISVRAGGARDAFEIAYMRGVVSFGLLTIVAALAPVTLGRLRPGRAPGLGAEQRRGPGRLRSQ